MKKIILGILALLLLQLVFAQQAPSINHIDTITPNLNLQGDCTSDGEMVLCLWSVEGGERSYHVYNITSQNLTIFLDMGISTWLGQDGNENAGFTCDYYAPNERAYCFVKQESTFDSDQYLTTISMKMDGTDVQNHSQFLEYGVIPQQIPSPMTSACDLRPGTDEVYCWSNLAKNVTYQNVLRYDIGADTWTNMKNMPYYEAQDTSDDKLLGSNCEFRNDNELWCFGGRNKYGTANTWFHIYNVTENATNFINSTFDGGITSYHPQPCKWVNDILYCYSILEHNFASRNDTYYYVASNASEGYFVDTIFPDVFGGSTAINETTDIHIAGSDSTISFSTYNVYTLSWELACAEDWQPYYSACTIGDNQTLLYNDNNLCGTFDDLPGDNGTISSCNYCTPIWTETSASCQAGDSSVETTYDWDNYGLCCGVTGLPTDCNIPANTTESCIGIHSSDDIGRVIVDFLNEFFIALIGLVTIITIGILYVWSKKVIQRK